MADIETSTGVRTADLANSIAQRLYPNSSRKRAAAEEGALAAFEFMQTVETLLDEPTLYGYVIERGALIRRTGVARG